MNLFQLVPVIPNEYSYILLNDCLIAVHLGGLYEQVATRHFYCCFVI